MRQRLDDPELFNPFIHSGLKYHVFSHTLTADNYQVTVNHPPMLIIDPDGAKDVRLPLEADSKGLHFVIYNAASGAETITVKDTAENGTVVSVGQGNFAFVFCDGVTWRGAVLDQTTAATLASLAVTGNGDIDGDLNVDGALQVDGLAKSDLGFQVNDVAVTATADGLTTGAITVGTGFAAVTSGNADHIITLPSGAAGNVGMVIRGWVGANGCEMRTPATSGATINGVDSDGTNEAAIPATTLFKVTLVAANTWILEAVDELGAPISEIVPDAA